MNRIRWKSFDVLKGLSCIAVVLIHYNFSGDLGLYVKTFCRFAVPTFLIISGFFFLSDGKMNDAKVVGKIRHITNLLLGSGIFYAIFTVVYFKTTTSSWNWINYLAERATAGKIVKFFFTNDPLVYSHLWYMLALIYCYAFSLMVFKKEKRIRMVYFIAPVVLVLYSCMQEFGAAIGMRSTVPIAQSDEVISIYNLFLFRALPFFLFGIIIKKNYERISRIPINTVAAVIIFIAGGCLAIYERTLFRESQFYVGTYIMVFAMVLTAVKKPESEIKLIGYIGRELSLYVYILHIAVGRTLDVVARELAFRDTAFYTWGRAFLVLILSLLVSQGVVSIKKLAGRKRSVKES